MKWPEDIRQILILRWLKKRKKLLLSDPKAWPLSLNLGLPTEELAQQQIPALQAWIQAWQQNPGPGELRWCEKRWRCLGHQCLPEKLILHHPEDLARWVGELESWQRAKKRYEQLVQYWPKLAEVLPAYFSVLADYQEQDFNRLCSILTWLLAHPESNLYPRQLPIPGLDSKWLETRKGLINDLLIALGKEHHPDQNFWQKCGLKMPPPLVRIRLLDEKLRKYLSGLSDISLPWEELATLQLPLQSVLIVENLQTGLAFTDLPGTLVLMRLGYAVDVLAKLPWLNTVPCFYWGDLDTHGFAILNRARSYLPQLQSVLMDEETLLNYRLLWNEEPQQHAAESLPLLTASEQHVYQHLKQHTWGPAIRLEQERIAWDDAMKEIEPLIMMSQV